MKYIFTFSSEDGDQTKDFDNLPDAETYMNDFIKGVERWSQTTFFPYDSHTSYRLFKDRKGRVIKIDKIESRECARCGNEFSVLSTLPDQTHCTQICYQLDNPKTNDGRQRHLLKRLQTELRNEGKANYREYIITVSTNGYRIGRVIGDESVGHIVYHVHCNTVAECIEWIDSQKRKGQTIDKDSCIKKDTLRSINEDTIDLAEIEHVNSYALTHSEIVFVDDKGNQYEYDGVCISEGKLKVSIKPIYNIKIK